MKKLIYTIGILLLTFSVYSQDLTDALRYSNYKLSGTARSAAMGNAFGALGGDFSSLSINPAGAAVYRSGEFTITPSFGNSSVDGTWLGTKNNESKYNLSLNNIGYVNTIPTGKNSESGLVSLSFGIGFNRLGNFSMNMLAEGSNANHSLLSYFTENVNDNNYFDPYYEQLAWDTYLINDGIYTGSTPDSWDENGHTRSRSIPTTDNNKGYFNDITDKGYGQSQRKTTERRGYINEYVLSFAANFNHKFYLGATLGIHDVYFKENANLYEYDAQNNIPYFNDLNFTTYLKTTGTGYNLKLGAIFKPTNNLRLGIAVHSPTFYKFNDLYDSGMRSSITYLSDGLTENYSAQPDKQGTYDYEIETPLKAVFSGAYVIGKSGLISVDYEIVNYSTAKIKSVYSNDDFTERNQTIKDAYKSVGNIHIGGEYRVNKNFSLRAGYENYPSVYKSTYLNTANLNSDGAYSTISGGFGYKQGNLFFDAALKHTMYNEYLKLYPGAIDMAKYQMSINDVIFTIGYKF